MAILFTCDRCGRRLKAGPTLAGKAVACQGCGARLVVPDPILDALTLPPPGPAPVPGIDDDDGTPYGLEDPAAGHRARPVRPSRGRSPPSPDPPPPGVTARPSTHGRGRRRHALRPRNARSRARGGSLRTGAAFAPASTFVPRRSPVRPARASGEPTRSGPTPRGPTRTPVRPPGHPRVARRCGDPRPRSAWG